MNEHTASGVMRLVLLLLALLLTPEALAQKPIGFGLDFAFDREGRSWIVGVAPGSAAEISGMRAGDLLVEISGKPMPLYNEGDAIGAARDSLPAPVVVGRGENVVTLSLGVGPYDLIALHRRSAAYLCASGDCVDGTGLWLHPNGKWYEGTFRDGRRHGHGVLTEDDGRVYVGDFVDQQRHGHGLYRWPDNTYWEGQWEDGQPLEGGVYTDENGTVTPGLRN